MSKHTCQKHFLDINTTFLNAFCHQKWAEGVLAVTGGSGRKAIFDPKNVQKMFL